MPETAVGCALDFLFRPRAEVLDLVRDMHASLRDSTALKIGIQVCVCVSFDDAVQSLLHHKEGRMLELLVASRPSAGPSNYPLPAWE